MNEIEQVRKEVNDFRLEVLTQLAVINSKLEGYPETKKTASEADVRSKQNEKDIKEIQDRNKWILRTSVGAIISSLISLLFLFVKLGLGV